MKAFEKVRHLPLLGKGTSPELTSNRLNKVRRSLFILLSSTVVVTGLLVASTIAQAKPTAKKVVVTMDCPLLFYDDENTNKGRTNTDEIRDILKKVKGLAIVQEATSLGWKRERRIRAKNPDLVIMHWSAFASMPRLREKLPAEEMKFISFLQYMGSSKAQFLIYTREPFFDEEGRRAWIQSCERKVPQLRGRIHLFEFPRMPERFRDPETQQALRGRVRVILGLD